MNENKIKTLLALAQLDAGQNQPDPREAMAGQMLMQMLGMNQQQETQAGQMDLDRERMAQAAQQFEMGQNNSMAMNREDLAMKKSQQEAMLAQAERQYGMDMLKVMSENQRASDAANQQKAMQEENAKLALQQIYGRMTDSTSPEALRFALEQMGWTGGTPVGAPAGGVNMEAELAKKAATSKNVNSVLGLPEGYKSPIYSWFH